MSTGAIIAIIVVALVLCCCFTHRWVIKALIKHAHAQGPQVALLGEA